VRHRYAVLGALAIGLLLALLLVGRVRAIDPIRSPDGDAWRPAPAVTLPAEARAARPA
jgi:hypothetical protein